MQTETVDSIVKECLIESELTKHFYAKYLYYVLKEVRNISLLHKTSFKQVKLTVGSYRRASIPVDFYAMIDMSVREGERLLPMYEDSRLNLMYNYDSQNNKIQWPDSETSFDNTNLMIYDTDGRLIRPSFLALGTSGWYGLRMGSDYAWTIDRINNEFVFSNRVPEGTELVLTYTTRSIDPTTATTVDPISVNRLKTYAHWQYTLHGNYPDYQVERNYREYKKAKNVYKAMIEPISYADLVELTRRGIHGGTKN
jgi:hypothetical protein